MSRPLIVDAFAGGGGASTGIEAALGRGPDIAINHDPEAIAMHRANHPAARHYEADVFAVDPRAATGGRPVDLFWMSPDCRHFSKAKGGRPVERSIRMLAEIGLVWARAVRPRIVMLENVEEFTGWGPLRDDGTPCPDGRGRDFLAFVAGFEGLGYTVAWRALRACDYGAPTSRRRLYLIARCDGAPIVWPAPTHAEAGRPLLGLAPWRVAADIVDWSLPCPSILDDAETIRERHGLSAVRPLAPATEARIARGVARYVLGRAEPFLVPRYGERPGQSPRTSSLQVPMPTIVPAGNQGALVAAFLAQHNTGEVGHRPDRPLSTIVGKGCTQGLVTATLTSWYGTAQDARLDAPVPTIRSRLGHSVETQIFIAPPLDDVGLAKARRLADLLRRHGAWAGGDVATLTLDGREVVLADIGMRMMVPRELFAAQGFPARYAIETGIGPDGAPVALTRTAQNRMAGNSVCPPVAEALVRANLGETAARGIAA